MKGTKREDLEKYLAHIRGMTFVRDVNVVQNNLTRIPGVADGVMRVRTAHGEHDFLVEIKRTHLTDAIADGIIAQAETEPTRPWILFIPYAGRQVGRRLAEHGVNYVDTVGNCRFMIGEDYAASIEGRSTRKPPIQGRGVGAQGHQVLFAILARPALLKTPVRTLAEAAGVGKTAAADALVRLKEEGLIAADRRGRVLLETKTLLDRWVAGYATLVRPRLLVGRYRTQELEPEALEERLEKALGDSVTWAWGGGAAAHRLTKYYRGEETVIHVHAAPADLPRRLRAVPADNGPLVILGVPGKVAFEGEIPRTVHPLLVYTELLTTGNPRAREAAEEIRTRFLHLKT